MFYNIEQYGKLIFTHPDIEYKTEDDVRAVTNRIAEKAKKHIEEGKMIGGSFDVLVCNEAGEEVDCFITDEDGVPES